MANILPTKAKQKLTHERRMRVAVSYVFALILVTLLSGILLIPIFLVASGKQDAIHNDITTLKELSALKRSSGSSVIMVNKQLERLSALDDEGKATVLFEKITAAQTSAIRLNGFFYSINRDDGATRLTTKGVADTRADLISFTENLRTVFSVVDLPVSNLAENTDVFFTISLSEPL
jgi:hypothetical protein